MAGFLRETLLSCVVLLNFDRDVVLVDLLLQKNGFVEASVKIKSLKISKVEMNFQSSFF